MAFTKVLRGFRIFAFSSSKTASFFFFMFGVADLTQSLSYSKRKGKKDPKIINLVDKPPALRLFTDVFEQSSVFQPCTNSMKAGNS